MPGDMVKIIIDDIYNKRVPKPNNLRPGYDMEHDYLSIIRPHKTLQQWVNRVRGPLQELLSKREYSCLSYIPYEYRRPRVHKSEMAICFKCWKLVKITEMGYEVESQDLMKNCWNYSCLEAKPEEAPLEPNKSYSLTSSKVTTPPMQCSVIPSHLNLPKDTVLRLRDGTEITIVN
ncbi:hypothetical protein C2G38_2181171 [Gigaspora rosea]|uniref:Uncharacterized protein n=1 Tax=Gigaspora rosea TaxID=44941 RepID=A0A397VIK4_9GLOM|nr:hypothetical protein C2G38_2181171 [Gigaspora rosea]